jgi:hypothetical protein
MFGGGGEEGVPPVQPVSSQPGQQTRRRNGRQSIFFMVR